MTGARLRVKPITPKQFKKDAFRLGMLNASHKIERFLTRQFKRTYSTWKKKPTYKTTISLKNNEVSIEHSTDNEIVRYLNFGTRVRHALMTNPFVAKTVPKRLVSRRGIGGVKIVSKKIKRPGIKARHWDKVVKRSLKRVAPKEFQAGIDYAIKRSGYAL